MRAKVICINEPGKSDIDVAEPSTSATEIQTEFDDQFAAFAGRFRPLTAEKEYWIREAVSASIMRKKLTELETNLLNTRMSTLTMGDDAGYESLPPNQRIALAWLAEAKSGSLEKIYAQTEQADNLFHRAHKKLMRLQKTA